MSSSLFAHTGGCPREVNGGIQWPWTPQDTLKEKPCREAGSVFRAGPLATRRCNERGEWEEADLTSCTLLADVEKPFLVVWFVIEADEYTPEMEQDFIQSVNY